MASCILTEGKYILLCSLVTNGHLDAVVKLIKDVCDEQEAICTLETFSRCSHMYDQMAPLVLAAQFGHIEIVKYLVSLVTQEQFVNSVATVYGIAHSGDELHHVTALNAACIRGYLPIVKFLVEKNASLSVADCTGSVPLCEAVFHGRYNIVEYLCEQGADVHTANDFGWQPIHIAALKDNTLAYKCLTKHNADSSARTPEGFTPLHIAALNGNKKVISQSMDLNEAVKGSFDDKYVIPSPLNLAAVYSGRNPTNLEIIHMILQLPDCSALNVCDVHLLMGVGHLVIEEHPRVYWKKAVTIMEENLSNFSRSEILGRREIQNSKELSELCGTQNPLADVEMWCQAVLIWEKRIGFRDMTYWEILRKAAEKIKMKPEREMLLLRGLEMVDQFLLPRLLDGFILPESFDEFYSSWVKNCFFGDKCEFESVLSFTSFVRHNLKIAKAISSRFNSLSSMYGCKKRSPLKLLSTILEVFDMWLKSTSSEIDPCELGKEFIEDFLMLNNDSTILHHIIKKKLFIRNSTVFDFLIQCGAGRALNVRYKGKTCLHIACISGDIDVIALLYDSGAHIDAVNEQGQIPLDIIKELHPKKTNEFVSRFCSTPLPLQCLAANFIVKYVPNYDSLPTAVRNYIDLHSDAF